VPIGRAALTAQLLDSREAIVALGAAWNALSHRGARSISATAVWYEAWIDTFGRTVAPRVIAVTDATAVLRGILPLAVLSRQVGGLRVRVLEMGGEAVACGDHLGLVAAAPTTGTVAPRLTLNGSAAAFEQSLSANRRQQLRRRERALGEAHPGHAFLCNDERVPMETALDDLERLHQALWNSRNVAGAFSDPLFGTFVRHFARAAHACGWLRLHQLVIDGETVAALLANHWEGVGSYYTSGWNSAFAEWHVGELLLAHVIRTAADEGLSSFDLGRCADAYKSQFAAEPVPLLTALWSTSARGHLAVGANRIALRTTRERNRWRTRFSRLIDTRRRPSGVTSE
jgi:CelD/BcsL family acetyltransferase involved in cellulose biosynthesis